MPTDNLPEKLPEGYSSWKQYTRDVTVNKLRELKDWATTLKRRELATRVGKTHQDNRDLWEILGYPSELRWDDFWEAYRRQNIARRIVDLPAKATWRHKPSVQETEDPNETTDFEDAFQRLDKRLRIFQHFQRLDRISGIGHYGVILLGLPGNPRSDPGTLRDPKDLAFLSVRGEGNAEVVEVEERPSNPRFGMPTAYRIKSSTVKESTNDEIWHWKRVIHSAEDLLENEVFGIPRLLHVWNRLLDAEKVVGGAGEAFWRNADRGMQFDIDPQSELDPDDESNFDTQIDEYFNQNRRALKTRGMTITPFSPQVADPGDTFNTIMQEIAGATGIPMRILLGTEAGQLASEQDENNWNARIQERQFDFAEPQILRQFIDRMTVLGVLPEPDEVIVGWPDLLAFGDMERSRIAQRVTSAEFNHARAKAQGVATMTDAEFRKRFLGLPSTKPDPEEDEQPPPPEEGDDGDGQDNRPGVSELGEDEAQRQIESEHQQDNGNDE